MIDPYRLVRWLQYYIPQFTDDFSEFTDVGKIVIGDAGKVSMLLSAPADLGVGNVWLQNARVRNRIIAAEADEYGVRFTTEYNHDLTAFMVERPGRQWPEGKSVKVEGLWHSAENFELSLEPTEHGVPNRRQFVANLSIIPEIDGNQYLIEDRSFGVNGLYEITDKISDTEYTLRSVVAAPELPAGELYGCKVLTGTRIALAASVDKAIELFTQHDTTNPFIFVIMGPRRAEREYGNSGHLRHNTKKNWVKINTSGDFSVIVFLPSSNELAAEGAQRKAYVDIFDILNKTLVTADPNGLFFDEVESSDRCSITYTGDAEMDYDTACYTHEYNYLFRDTIVVDSGFVAEPTVALRDVHMSFGIDNKYGINEKVPLKINVDIEELENG